MAHALEVFLVDQDHEVRFTVRKQLAQAQLQVAGESPFGTEAVSRAAELRPDVILCALEEPFVRPLETIEALQGALPTTPIIVYSSRNEIEIARKAMLAGARDYLVRPFRAEALLSAVQTVLGTEEQRRLRLSGRGAIGIRGTVLPVYSAKGGVGKTTIAANLAAALAKQVGQSVAIVDADTSFGDVAVAMDLRPETDVLTLLDAITSEEEVPLDDVLAHHGSGARVLAPPKNVLAWNQVDPERFIDGIELLARNYDYVVVDLSPNPNPITMLVLDAASLILWVVNSDVTAVRDNLHAIQLLREIGISLEKIRFVLNHVSPKDEVSGRSIESALERPIYWNVPYDRQLTRDAQLGRTVAENGAKGKASRSIVELAGAVAGLPGVVGGAGASRSRGVAGLIRGIGGTVKS